MGWSTPGWSDARACQAGSPGCGAFAGLVARAALVGFFEGFTLDRVDVGEAVLRRTVAPARRWFRGLRHGDGGTGGGQSVAVLGETGHVAASTR